MMRRNEYLKTRVFWDFKDMVSKDEPLSDEDVRKMCLPIERIPDKVATLIRLLGDTIDEFCVIEKVNGVYVEYPIYLASSRGIELEIYSSDIDKTIAIVELNGVDLNNIFNVVEVKFTRSEELNRVMNIIVRSELNGYKISIKWFNYAIKMIYYPHEEKLVIK